MRCTNEAGFLGRRSLRLPCLLACLAIAGTVDAGQTHTQSPARAQTRAQPQQTNASGKHHHKHYKTFYRIVNLNAGDFFALPRINDSGQVSYSVRMGAGRPHGYFYDGAVLHDIGNLGGTDSYAVDLNNAGQVTGRSSVPGGNEHAFVWSLGGGMIDLGTLPGATDSRGEDINNAGVVVGTSDGMLFAPRAIRWTGAGPIENLGSFTPGLASLSGADAVNDAGLVSGSSITAAFDVHGFYWTPLEGLVDIDPMGGRNSRPRAVGALGEIAGTLTYPGLINHAFLWTAGTGMVDLGTAGGQESAVIAMSPNTRIAGVFTTLAGDQRAMTWTQAGGMTDLGTLGGSRSRAQAVNNKGAVVGLAETKQEDVFHGFIWTPKQGMTDLNKRLCHAPPGFAVEHGLAINDGGTIAALSNAGVVVLKPVHGHCKDGKDDKHDKPHKDPHALGPIAAPYLARIGTTLQPSFGFVDEDLTGTRSVTWSWGDGSAGQAARVRENNGLGRASASHRYDTAGIHMITASVVDRAGRKAEVGRQVVVYDATAGMTAGNGRLDSPAGALRADLMFAGRADFALIAPAQGTGSAGQAGTLQFVIPGLALRSDSLAPVALQPARRQYAGSATVNGRGGYRYALTVTRAAPGKGGQARIGLKVWHTDPVSKQEVVDYDNQVRPTDGDAGGPRIASAARPRFHPAGSRVVDGALVFH